MFNDNNNPLLPNGCYSKNLLADSEKHVFIDQPQGVQIIGGQREDVLVPPGMLIIRDFLDADTCRAITEYADQQEGSRLEVMTRDPITGVVVSRPDEGRITEYVNIHGIYQQLSQILGNACRNILSPHYKVDIEWYEKPSMLRYGVGGKYEHHSDSENWDINTRAWNRFCDRAYSILIYLNDNYTGGALYFRNLDYRLIPTIGTMVAFPSDHRYVHRAEPVESGIRYAVVSWIVVKGHRYFTKGKPVPPHAVAFT